MVICFIYSGNVILKKSRPWMIAAGPIKVGGETSASEQKGVMQWTGTLFRNVGLSFRHCRFHWIMAAWELSCFLTLFFLVPLCWCAVSKRQMLLFFFCGRFSCSKQTSLSKWFLWLLPWLHHYVNVDVIPKQKKTKYCLKHEGKSHPCHPWQN